MTLAETLEQYRGQRVKIGAASSFIFCGRIDYNTATVLTAYVNDYLENRKKDLRRLEKELKLLKNDLTKWSEKKRQIKANIEEYVENFKPILEREVKEIYSSILEPKVKIISVDGGEIGNCWDESEYRKKHRSEESEE